MMKLAEGSAVKSADRVLSLLELLAASKVPQTFAGISKALEIPKSSLFQLLRNLLRRGYVVQDGATGAYQLGPKFKDLLDSMAAPSLGEIAAPFVEAAARQLNETASFYARADDLVVVECSTSGGQSLAYSMQAGDTAPIYAVSAGRVILSKCPASELDKYLAKLKPEAFTKHTKLNPVDIRKTVERAAETGFGYSFEEFTPGIVGIARAVEKDGVAIGAVTFAIPTVRFEEDTDREVQRILRSTVTAIENALKKVSNSG